MSFKIPFSVLPPKIVLGLSKRTKSAGNFVAALFPGLKENIIHAQMDVTAREYAAIALIVAPLNAIVFGALVLLVGLLTGADVVTPLVLTMVLVGTASFLTVIIYPQIIATRRMRRLERELVPATRQLIIELKSGVPLFNAMASITGDYGEVSIEFKKIITKINNGVPELDALADASRENPSLQFQKILWQMSNALKTGSDVGTALEAILEELIRERVNQIRRYGQELSPWIMIYMLAAVVLPTLGVTLLIVIASFLAIPVPKMILPIVLVFLLGFQLFFANLVSTRRPAV